jgi:L-threonylcarbamoyladenylate synthase
MSLISQAAALLRQGRLVVFPTETVYGLGADATNATAVGRIFSVKGRPATNPLIVHVADTQIARLYVTHWPAAAEKLADTFWPGPLTLVLPKSPDIVDAVTAGRATVGLRTPDHPLALELLRAFAGPVAAPSANRSNHISPTTAEHVRGDLGDEVDLILDGGPCHIGIESTVIDLSSDKPTILRPGGISRHQIEAIVGPVRLWSGTLKKDQAAASPGQAAVHYAPKAKAYRFAHRDFHSVADWCRRELRDEQSCALVKLVDSATAFHSPTIQIANLPSNPARYAQRLYALLRSLDSQGIELILIEMPPKTDAWAAVTDRLMRATLPLP